MPPGLRCATASSFTYDWRAPPPDAPGFVPAVRKAKAEQRAIALSASRAQSWPGGLFAQVKEEAVAQRRPGDTERKGLPAAAGPISPQRGKAKQRPHHVGDMHRRKPHRSRSGARLTQCTPKHIEVGPKLSPKVCPWRWCCQQKVGAGTAW